MCVTGEARGEGTASGEVGETGMSSEGRGEEVAAVVTTASSEMTEEDFLCPGRGGSGGALCVD